MRSIPFLLAALLMLPMFADASACVMTTSNPQIDTGAAGVDAPTRIYVRDDCGLIVNCFGALFSLWVYEESNGIDGMQRDDEWRDDTCGGAAGRPDTLIL